MKQTSLLKYIYTLTFNLISCFTGKNCGSIEIKIFKKSIEPHKQLNMNTGCGLDDFSGSHRMFLS